MTRTGMKILGLVTFAAGSVATPTFAADDTGARQPNKGRTDTQQSGRAQPQTAQDAPRKSPSATESNRVTFEQAQELSSGALTHITSAQQALGNRDTTAAQRSLDAAANALRQLYDGVPGKQLMSALGGKGDIDLAPIFSTMRSTSVFVDPAVVAQVEEAKKRADKGDQAAAQEQLRLARSSLAADIALLPVESAYAYVVAAQSELRNGQTARATELLRNVPLVMEHVTMTAPLVPVRFDLRAAAAAAEANDWTRAGELVESAKQDLQQLASSPVADQQEQKMLQSLAKKVTDIDRRIDSGKKPQPREIRDLAKQTRPASTGTF